MAKRMIPCLRPGVPYVQSQWTKRDYREMAKYLRTHQVYIQAASFVECRFKDLCMQKYLYQWTNDLYKVVYGPYEDLPLFVSSKMDAVRTLAVWRLQKGR